jgi:hypothetical protein
VLVEHLAVLVVLLGPLPGLEDCGPDLLLEGTLGVKLESFLTLGGLLLDV